MPDAVRSDDRADPATELDVRPLREGLEALEPRASSRAAPAGTRLVDVARRVAAAVAVGPFACASPPAPPDALDRLGRRGGLGDPTRRALADAEQLAVDPDLDAEGLLVVGPAMPPRAGSRVAHPMRRCVYSCRRVFGLLSERTGGSSGQLRLGERRCSQSRTGVVAEVEVERAGQAPRTRRPAGTAGDGRCAATRPRRGGGPPEVDAAGEAGETGGRDDRRASGGQGALVIVGMAGVQGLGDGQVDDSVAEELEPFVVSASCIGVLVQPAGVDEGLFEEVEVPDREAEAARRRPVRVAPRTCRPSC